MGSTTRVVSGEQNIDRHLIALSAKTEDALYRKIVDLLAWLEAEQEQPALGDIAYTLWRRRTHYAVRTGFLVRDWADLHQQLGEVSRSKRLPSAKRSGERTDLIEELLERYLAGGEPDGESLYADARYRCLPLPTYPFVEERYWLPDQAEIVEQIERVRTADRLHPLLDCNSSSFSEQKFTTRFTGREFFLQDHQIGGQPMLPGVAYLEMGRAAAELSGADQAVCLEQIVWARPVLAAEAQDVHISLYPSDERSETIEFEVWSEGEQESTLHAQGLVRCISNTAGQRLDLEAIEQRCTVRLGADEYYRALQNLGLDYGPSMRAIQELSLGSQECIARLKLPEGLQSDFADFKLHPALLDGALQATVGLLERVHQREQVVYLPFALEAVRLIRPLPKHGYAYVKAQGSSGLKYDVLLTDEAGYESVVLAGLSVRAFDLQKAGRAKVGQVSTLDLLEKLSRGELSVQEVEQVLGGGS
ncbi:polyketide synthase dehydratase domain-containing protein [Tumebacillus lipolyticus]|uniref:Polyketide synthase dehydratase domain-containing protein n=1 Tax=Tumebacillus lipolyticus TaxID=1280370 RepID=A0ABW4ZSH1_9BACL